MKKTIITITALTIASVGAIALAEPKENNTVAQPTPHKIVRAEKKKTEQREEQPKQEIVAPEQQEIIVDNTPVTQQEVTQDIEIVEPVNTPIITETVSQEVTEPINDIEPQKATIKLAPQRKLSELDPALWTTLVNISKTVNETPNEYWTIEEGQVNFERIATKLHDMGGVPREKGVA